MDVDAGDLVLLRSCFDYHTDPDRFDAFVDAVAESPATLRNPPDLVRWNRHKFYLRDLADAGVPILETEFVNREADRSLQSVLDDRGWEKAVVKPAVGTSSAGVFRTERSSPDESAFAAALADRDLLVQAFAPEIADGEWSFVFFGGTFAHATRHVPADGEFRSQGTYGGTVTSPDPTPALVDQARSVLDRASAIEHIPSARVDGVERDGRFVLMELELVEPYLSMGRRQGLVEQFVDAIEASV
ncbi:MAG: RimK family alpha-L-glutamate ligase [Halanaeroarchaeum sp.]